MKRCTKCKCVKPLQDFGNKKARPDGLSCWCRACEAKRHEVYRATHIIKRKPVAATRKYAYDKGLHERIRLKIFQHYGMECACCHENIYAFLEIDHINGNGSVHRKAINRRGGSGFYKWLITHNYPDEYQVLCSNCNRARHRCGICPHQTILANATAT